MGRYHIVRQLHRSSSGTVLYLARDPEGESTVIVKVLPLDVPDYDQRKRRFFVERQIVAGMNHPNVVGILDYGADRELNFVVFEYVDGTSLNRIIHDKREIPLAETLPVIRSLCSALDHVHRNGIVHYDIRPSHILITGDGVVKLIGFGEAYLENSSVATVPGVLGGSPFYSAPEQSLGMKADRRTDIYSLGIVFFEMLTGQPPYIGESTAVTVYMHQEGLLPVSLLRPLALPEKISAALIKALDKNPDQRFQSAEAFLNELVMDDGS